MTSRMMPTIGKVRIDTERKLNEFNLALRNLRCEGKVAYGRNVKQIRLAVKFLKLKLKNHIYCEEKLLFPSIKKSIPKLEPTIQVLTIEHNELVKHLKEIDLTCSKIGRDVSAIGNNRIIQYIYETGQVFIFLFKHHAHLEQQRIYKSVEEELKAPEKRRLIAQMSRGVRK